MKRIIIAIDGHSSCGKSTMAKDLAKDIGYIYVDTGAMYRAVTLYSIQNNLWKGNDLDAKALENDMPNIKVGFKYYEAEGRSHTLLNGVDVEKEIRGMEVSSKVSPVAALPFVREAMVRQQQDLGRDKGLVMDGRDIGTTVFPNAELKIFVTASPEVRAQRRLDEMRLKGDQNITFEEVLKNLNERDYIDSHREVSPLKQAEDAIVLDNSNMTIAEQKQWLIEQFNARIK